MKVDYTIGEILEADASTVEEPLDFVLSHNRVCFTSIEHFLEEGSCWGEQHFQGFSTLSGSESWIGR